ncbi:MAG: alpha-glucuronidase [Lachnospiraceae bacterium]|nr:alpha-glucuronidase [Lachnospiraceae bacterium]
MEKNWTSLWLKYHAKASRNNLKFCEMVHLDGFNERSAIISNALEEFFRGVNGMLGVKPSLIKEANIKNGLRILRIADEMIPDEGFRLTAEADHINIEASGENGVLYGIFFLLRQILMEKPLDGINITSIPDIKNRMLNHWDNLDGSIERGYSGSSFFFKENKILVNERTKDYARLIASIGINGVVINNVNVKDAATFLITPAYFDEVRKLKDIFAGYGIKLFLSLNFAAPLELGGPDSADPFDEEVISWWRGQIATVYEALPGLGGFLVKADSEGRPGPFTYGRTQADGANMLARLLKPYGGLVIWRCFVYNCTQDWRDRKTDRARAGYDNFIKTDGDYLDNVVLQIKNGPMDFQIREPVSPLLGGLKETNQMLEVQIAQEYTGHQIDVCYLVPMFKEVLGFNHQSDETIFDVIKKIGFCAVTNTGNDENWTGNDLAAANLYGFGRLAWSVSLTAAEIAEEWIKMTLSCDEETVSVVKKILLSSRETYEKYTSPLGIGWMVTPHLHYGPSVDGYEYSLWGTYHRSDHLGIGVDRTLNGTGYTSQYHEPNASLYDDIETCPEELLLFFHHVPYKYVLKSGKTLIQHIYDTHFEGVLEVEEMIRAWEGLSAKIPAQVFKLVKERFSLQLINAKEWRDQVNTYFYRKSGIKDEKGREIF